MKNGKRLTSTMKKFLRNADFNPKEFLYTKCVDIDKHTMEVTFVQVSTGKTLTLEIPR